MSTTLARATTAMPAPLVRHLRSWAGAIPARPGLAVVANPRVARPGWNGRPELLTGLVAPSGAAVVSLPPGVAYAAGSLLGDDGPLDVLPALLGRPDVSVERRVYRWTTSPADLPRIGRWRPADHPAVPAWLRPFGGHVLVAEDSRGEHLAGVGIKRHDSVVHELAVGTVEHVRGHGFARLLVAQAAAGLLSRGVVPTYRHVPGNAASARVAEAVGFVDAGWQSLALSDS
jgi:GNAT superfamily N-acetyltransferase